jgi:predicted dehydrogenase
LGLATGDDPPWVDSSFPGVLRVTAWHRSLAGYIARVFRMNPESASADLNRREFVKAGSFAAMIAAMGGVPLNAQEVQKAEQAAGAAGGEGKVLPPPTKDPNYKEKPPAKPLKIGVIGLGTQGRDILTLLGKLPNGPVVALCDNYKAAFRRAAEAAPKATQHSDYTALLADPEVQGVITATPTHLHREIALAAMKSGKHVYLEAPIAHTIDDARAIAQAAKALPEKQVFQVGLQARENPQNHHVLKFIRTGATGKAAQSRGQWNRKQSWRRSSPNGDRERALNWRLFAESSVGLAGEIGMHSLDLARWYLGQLPVAVNGFGGVIQWQDGREVADTVTVVLEFKGGVQHTFTATLANSFEGEHDVFFGSDAAVLIRDNKAWMFKETDAPLLGWEVYARKDDFLSDSGIALVANATKILAQGKKPAEAASQTEPPLKYALERFIEHADDGSRPDADWKAGFEAAVLAIKANEAVRQGGRIVLDPAWFQV